MDALINVLRQSWWVLGDMAPYLLFGFAMAGLLSIWISPEWTERHLGGRGLLPVLKAALLGIPLPLCSCSVIPVVASMRRHGASRAAATSFLLSTPQTGVDSISVTYALLGLPFAIFRPIAALISGLLGGVLVLLLGERSNGNKGQPELPPCTESCCTGDRRQSAWLRAARYGLVTLPRDLVLPLLVGTVIAGALTALTPENRLNSYLGGGTASILLLMVAGVPLYVCATASVPIAAGLIHLGASPGAALAFLIAGPATNPATLTTIWKVLGRRTALLYLLTVGLSAAVCGLLLDMLFRLLSVSVPHMAAHDHMGEQGGLVSSLWAAALLAVLAFSWLASRRPAAAPDRGTPAAAPAPEPSCHCACSKTPHSHGTS